MNNNARQTRRIGFVATRISSTDGVSLEIRKWAEILTRLGHDCFYVCGKSDRPAERTFLIEEADFLHPDILEITRQCFGRQNRSRAVTQTIDRIGRHIKDKLYEAIDHFELDLIIAQNSLTIPLNIPLGAALVQVLIETGIPCIAHHHDFAWERQRFLVNAVDDYLRAAFPPPLAAIEHVVINTLAGEEFSRRTGLPCHIIPNVMDFDHPPPPPDDSAAGFRRQIGLAGDDVMILQPTRVVHRKGIEHSVELVRRLEDPRCKLVITHDANDEGDAYARRIRSYAELLEVPLIFADRWIGETPGAGENAAPRFSIWDVYRQADLVTYPSTYEGFGNAFLEATYYKRPIFCNRYTIFRTDIEPLGLRAIVMDGYVTDEAVEHVRRVLSDADYRHEMVEANYAAARRFFSFQRAEGELRWILSQPRCQMFGRA